MDKKETDCKRCDDLLDRLARLEKRITDLDAEKHLWRKRWGRVDEQLKEANGQLSLLMAKNEELKQTAEDQAAKITTLQKELFASSTEASPAPAEESQEWETAPPKRRRGKQLGTKGYGRKIRSSLPVQDVFVDLDNKCCSTCGLERELVALTEDSEEIQYEVKLVRVRHKRRKYKKTCKCKGEPAIVTAPVPPKLIPKGMFSCEFWAHILIEKYLLQRPLSRVCWSLRIQGLEVSDGTLSSGLKNITKLFAPLYNAIRAKSRTARHWQMDETHWQVFTDLMGKENHKWWMWVVETASTSVFLLDPTRSSSVPKRHLSNITTGVVSCDRYSAYHPLIEQGILLSYCWAHVRRDLIKLRDGYPSLQRFACNWIQRIDSLFHHNKQRSQSPSADLEVHSICELMHRDAKKLLKRKGIHSALRSFLESLQKHWHGLTLFLKYPHLPLDNNASERALRNAAIGRKCYYGSHSIWGGALSAMLFSLFSTLQKNNIDQYQFLVAYLKTCAANKGSPPHDISNFLPWSFQSHSQNESALTMVH